MTDETQGKKCVKQYKAIAGECEKATKVAKKEEAQLIASQN